MRDPIKVVILAFVILGALSSSAQSRKQSKVAPKILSAKSIYFDDRSGSPAVAREALFQLLKWDRFKIVDDRKNADLIFLFSSDPYHGGYVIFSGSQTGTIDKNGQIQEDPVPMFNKQAPVRYAYLTVIDPATGDSLWSADHQWGGLLTGFNSAGARLVTKLRKQVEK